MTIDPAGMLKKIKRTIAGYEEGAWVPESHATIDHILVMRESASIIIDLVLERDHYREAFFACRGYHANNTGANALRLKAAVAALPKGKHG
jgi:hypothetical protein